MLSALSLDLVVALAQRPEGAGASELARIAEAAPTSVQNSLRLMTAHGLVRRGSSKYALALDHPAAAEVLAVALRLPPPNAAIRLVLRACTAVEFACVDAGGFIVGTHSNPAAGSLAALDAPWR